MHSLIAFITRVTPQSWGAATYVVAVFGLVGLMLGAAVTGLIGRLTPGPRVLISTEGGSDPVWAPDGRELFYRLGSHMMSVPVQFTPAFAAGTPRLLFDGAFETSELGRNFDVSADGQRFLVIRSENAEPPPEFHFVFNWAGELDESGQRR